MKLPAVAVNAAVVPPAATATDAGTPSVGLLLASEMAEPPAGAAALRVIVQLEVLLGERLDGVQVKDVIEVVKLLTLMVAPVPLAGRLLPLGDAATGLVTPIQTIPNAPGESVMVTVATIPFCMKVEFNPVSKQVSAPLAPAQAMDFPAAAAAGPGLALIAVTLAGG